METIDLLNPSSLILSDIPSNITIKCASGKIDNWIKTKGCYPPPIVIAKYDLNRFVIIDGNHRACVLAQRNMQIGALLLTKDLDRDDILKLELHTFIPPFPKAHRDFLMSHITLKELKNRVIGNAINEGLKNVIDSRIQLISATSE